MNSPCLGFVLFSMSRLRVICLLAAFRLCGFRNGVRFCVATLAFQCCLRVFWPVQLSPDARLYKHIILIYCVFQPCLFLYGQYWICVFVGVQILYSFPATFPALYCACLHGLNIFCLHYWSISSLMWRCLLCATQCTFLYFRHEMLFVLFVSL